MKLELAIAALLAPFEHQAGEFVRHGCRKSKGPDLGVGGMVVLAELPDGVESWSGILVDEGNEVAFPNEVYLAGVHDLCRRFVASVRDCGTEAEYLAGLRDSQYHGLAVLRISGQLHTSAAEHIYAVRRLPFEEEHCAL